MLRCEEYSKVTITESLKSRFCKDMSLPIKVFQEPYFTNFMRLYDPFYNCIELYEEFVALVNFYGGESAYMEAYNALKDSVIEFLKQNEKMVYFSQQEDMNKFAVKNQGFPTSDIYKVTNRDCNFVSIDMVKANFTALHHYAPEIVDGCETYEDFIGKFTDKEFFKKSKYIRQVIFGNVNPKRQVTYERYLMDKVLTKILEGCKENGFDTEDLVAFFSTDEIVLRVDKEIVSGRKVSHKFYYFIQDIVSSMKEENINIRATFFSLHCVEDICENDKVVGFVKYCDFDKQKVEFKCMSSLLLPFACCAYSGSIPDIDDSVFMCEGKLARLVDIPQLIIV